MISLRLDRIIGVALFIIGVMLSGGYTWVLFFSQLESLKWWAIVIPVYVIVIIFAFIAAWLGWIMMTTPPPKPLEDLTEEVREKLKKLREELKAQ